MYKIAGYTITYHASNAFSFYRYLLRRILINSLFGRIDYFGSRLMLEAEGHEGVLLREVAITANNSTKMRCFNVLRWKKHEDVDVWEKTEIDKIRKRYEKMKKRTVLLEDEEKSKALIDLERGNIKLEDKMGREILRHKLRVAKIDAIATGAVIKLDREMRKLEANVKEKARKMRADGKFSYAGCFMCI